MDRNYQNLEISVVYHLCYKTLERWPDLTNIGVVGLIGRRRRSRGWVRVQGSLVALYLLGTQDWMWVCAHFLGQ